MDTLEFRDIPQPLERRIEIARDKDMPLDPNCYGTAFFLLGVLPYDVVVFTGKGYIQEAIRKMERHSEPADNSIMISRGEKDKIFHASYIHTANQFKGFHRIGSMSPFKEISSIKDVDDYLDQVFKFNSFFGISKSINDQNNWKHEFYTLRKNDKLEDWSKKIVAAFHYGWDG